MLAQHPTPALPDPVVERIWNEGMEHSRLPALAHVLLDSVGPRLAGSPAMDAGRRWLLSTYESWGIPARNERYGTWKGWQRGISHVDMLAPRVRALEGTLLAWSRSTTGAVTAPAVLLPDARDQAAFDAWLPLARGKLMLLSRVPLELGADVGMENPGLPGPGGSDYATFDCRGIPVFNLISTDWDYDDYTWHTNRDSFDKISFDDLERSATLVAMLAYQASEDPRPFSRQKRQLFPVDPETGEAGSWPVCGAPDRSWTEGLRSR